MCRPPSCDDSESSQWGGAVRNERAPSAHVVQRSPSDRRRLSRGTPASSHGTITYQTKLEPYCVNPPVQAFASLIASRQTALLCLALAKNFYFLASSENSLPTTFRQTVRRRKIRHINTDHRLAQTTGRVRHRHRIIKLRGRFHNRLRACFRVA